MVVVLTRLGKQDSGDVSGQRVDSPRSEVETSTTTFCPLKAVIVYICI